MTKRTIAALCVVAALGVTLAIVRAPSVEAQQTATLCTMPEGLTYSPGALEEHDGQIYQCVSVYGENLSPRGVAWIKVSRLPNVFVPQVR